jgi:acyl-CoA thioesterase I
VPVSLRGRNWDTSVGGLQRIESDVLQQKNLSHVIILFGNNDCWLQEPDISKVPLPRFRENILKIAQTITANQQLPVLCNLQLINFKRFASKFPELLKFKEVMNCDAGQIQEQYSCVVEDAARSAGISCVDIRGPLKKSSEDVVASDGVHPNDLGHKIIAEAILAHLQLLAPSLEIVRTV